MNDRRDISWAPRVNLNEIDLLYRSCAGGLYDEEKIDNIGIALYLRCESILEFTAACNEGRVKCKRCISNNTETYIIRKTNTARELLRCVVCGWQIQWRVYISQTDKITSGQLGAGRAFPAFEAYYKNYPKYKEPAEKMIAIDTLIHEFHWFLRNEHATPVADRTACVCLLEGNATDIMQLLDKLTYGENINPELLKSQEIWNSRQIIARKSRLEQAREG